MEARGESRRIWNLVDRSAFHLILAGSLTLNVYLGLKVRASPMIPQSLPSIALGARAPALYAETLAREKTIVNWTESSKPWILYIFSPSCVWCGRNFDNFDAIVQLKQSDFRIIALSTTSEHIKEYVEKHPPAYPIYMNADASKSSIYLQTGTPTTYLISPEGVVLAMWRGAYVGDTKKAIEAKLNIKLPGVSVH